MRRLTSMPFSARFCTRALAGVALACVTFSSSAGAQQEKPPTKSQAKKLVDEWWELDSRDADQFKREQEILARLSLVELGPAAQKSWRKDLAKRHSKKGRKLEKKAGAHRYWEEEKKGVYIVGGKTSKPEGLIIGMHGGGVGSGDPFSMHPSISAAASELDMVSICPGVLELTEHGWTDSGTEEWVIDLVDAAIRTWDIDPAKVYFSGHSMGGYGTWTLGARHADRVAGLGPSAGAPTPVRNYSEEIIDIDTGVVPNLINVPMLVFQSTDDPRVPPDVNQAAVRIVEDAKKKWGGYENFRYWEVHDKQHELPEGGMLALLEPLSEFSRNPVPERIVWQPRLEWKRQFYWLWWETPAIEAILVADLDRDANAVRIQCEESVSGMRILIDERVLDIERQVVVSVNGKEVVRGMVKPTLGDFLRTCRSPDTGLQFMYSLRVP